MAQTRTTIAAGSAFAAFGTLAALGTTPATAARSVAVRTPVHRTGHGAPASVPVRPVIVASAGPARSVAFTTRSSGARKRSRSHHRK